MLVRLISIMPLSYSSPVSLSYPSPAQRETPCITIVICPLVALMEDQVKRLSKIVKGKLRYKTTLHTKANPLRMKIASTVTLITLTRRHGFLH